MSNRLDDCCRTALEEQACIEAESILAKYLKQFPVSREAVEALERNLLELALAAKIAASKPPENVIQTDDGMHWHKGADLMDNIFLCHRPTTGGTEYAVVEHFQTNGTNEIWNRGWDAVPDPLARESVPNPFGGRNSILRVATSPEAAHLADAENIPLKNDRFSESVTGDHLVAEENLP
jgi:hypothetical protein